MFPFHFATPELHMVIFTCGILGVALTDVDVRWSFYFPCVDGSKLYYFHCCSMIIFPVKPFFGCNIAHHIPHNINFYTHPHLQPSKSSPKRPDPIALVISPRTTPGCGTRITTIAATSGPTASPPPPASVATAWWSTATGRRWWQLGSDGFGGGF